MTSAAATILVIDDDPVILETLEPALKEAGYTFRSTPDANQGFATLTNDTIDLVILDVRLPGISGLKLLEIMKGEPRTASIPVLMLTSQKKESEKVQGLATGADDYLVKPFSVKELLARVHALLRRSRHAGRMDRVIEVAGIRIDLDTRKVTASGAPVALRPTELNMLLRLMERPGQVLTYQILSEALSEGSRIMTSGTLHAHVKNLRQKLGKSGERIETVHTIGFRLNAD